jgi:hypothetical protein
LFSTQINKASKTRDRMRRKMIYHVAHPFGASDEYLSSAIP